MEEERAGIPATSPATLEPFPPISTPQNTNNNDIHNTSSPSSHHNTATNSNNGVFNFMNLQRIITQEITNARHVLSDSDNAIPQVNVNIQPAANELNLPASANNDGVAPSTGNNLTEEDSPSRYSNHMSSFDSSVKSLEKMLPFVLLLSIVFLYEHRRGLFAFAWNTSAFLHANQQLKKQVNLKEKRHVPTLLCIAAALIFHTAIVYLFYREDQLWKYLIFLPPPMPLSFWDTLWVVVINDFIVRFMTMAIKSLTVAAVGSCTPQKRNAQLYSLIESVSVTYGSLIPTMLWIAYFGMLREGAGQVFSYVMVVFYVTFKFAPLVDKVRNLSLSLRRYIFREVQYGKYATKEQIAQVGDHCPICQEKLASPIILRCSHIFCEDCVSEWLQREKTCPMCRASIAMAGRRTHADGTTTPVLEVF
eukprot:TRINITY_DN6549_c0_g1_i1.p1 TRINITY_DN6549_c0_g1~~TRINITY_DN6549_c0_g1_i1.p1  ORF type:complete len:436 (-),score=114.92 TRINITY_DN6549_c0_g1_i1:25-1284(-)